MYTFLNWENKKTLLPLHSKTCMYVSMYCNYVKGTTSFEQKGALRLSHLSFCF